MGSLPPLLPPPSPHETFILLNKIWSRTGAFCCRAPVDAETRRRAIVPLRQLDLVCAGGGVCLEGPSRIHASIMLALRQSTRRCAPVKLSHGQQVSTTPNAQPQGKDEGWFLRTLWTLEMHVTAQIACRLPLVFASFGSKPS